MRTLIAFLILVSSAQACGRCGCFVTCKKVVKPVKTKVIDVQFRHLRFIDQRKPQTDFTTELALQRQWEIVTSAIPIAARIDQKKLFRHFQFRNNLSPYPGPPEPIQDAGYQVVKSVKGTKVLRGLVDFSLRVEADNNVNLIQPFQTTIESQNASPGAVQAPSY